MYNLEFDRLRSITFINKFHILTMSSGSTSKLTHKYTKLDIIITKLKDIFVELLIYISIWGEHNIPLTRWF